MNAQEVIQFLEQKAPLSYQESYDNAGLIVGHPSQPVSGILTTLDATEAVIDEAIAKGCNLVVAHHPIVFGGLKKINGKNYVERAVIKAIKHDIAIYAAHTNLDHVHIGVNAKICDMIGIPNPRILSPKKQVLYKLTTFVPTENLHQVRTALYAAGAGNIGNYNDCSFVVQGTGTFKPNDSANPQIGTANQLESVSEARLEVILPEPNKSAVLRALKQSHPYEEVAYYLHLLENEHQEVGAGMIGDLPQPVPTIEFLQLLKEKMGAEVVKYTDICRKHVQRVAVCGGAGSFLLKKAIAEKADLFITADYKYHEFFDADGQIIIADIGHYESEQFTKNLLADWLGNHFPQISILVSDIVTNPVHYL